MNASAYPGFIKNRLSTYRNKMLVPQYFLLHSFISWGVFTPNTGISGPPCASVLICVVTSRVNDFKHARFFFCFACINIVCALVVYAVYAFISVVVVVVFFFFFGRGANFVLLQYVPSLYYGNLCFLILTVKKILKKKPM